MLGGEFHGRQKQKDLFTAQEGAQPLRAGAAIVPKMEPPIFRMRFGKAMHSGSLNGNIPITKIACSRLKRCFGENQSSPNTAAPILTPGWYRGSRGTSDGREDVEYRLRFENDGSVSGTLSTAGFDFEVQGRYDAEKNRYMWAETPPGSSYAHSQNVNVYSSHVSSIALLNHSNLSKEGVFHVEVCLKLVSNGNNMVSLVGEYTRSDGKTGDQRLLLVQRDLENVGNPVRGVEQHRGPDGAQYQPGFNPWMHVAVAKKATRRMLDLEVNPPEPHWSKTISQELSGRYRGSREGREGRVDLHYCLKFLPSGIVRGSMLTNGNIFEVVGWYNSKTRSFEWGETPVGTSYAYATDKGYYAAQVASLALLSGAGLVQEGACHVEVSLKPLIADSVCLIGDYASSESNTGDQRLVFVEAIRDIDPIPSLNCSPYSGFREGLSENSHLWRHIPVVKRARDRMEEFLHHHRNNGDFVNVASAPRIPSGRFCGSRGERDGRVDVDYDLRFLAGGLVEGTMSTAGMQFEVKGGYNSADRKFEWAETPVGAEYVHIGDIDAYCDGVARNFLFPGVFQGRAMHVEVSVGLVNVDSACLIGDCTRRDGSVGDLRLVFAESNPQSVIQTESSQPSIDWSCGSIDFSQFKVEPLLEKENLI